MTALRAAPEASGYPPAHAARLESERALTRGMLLACLVVAAGLSLLSLLQLVRGAPVPIPVPALIDHVLVDPPGSAPPPSPSPQVIRPSAPAASGPPVIVPDNPELPDQKPAAAASTGAGEGSSGTVADPGQREGVREGGYPRSDGFVMYDEPPQIVQRVTPEYPDMARDAGVEGTVLLWALIDLDGSVHDVMVKRSVPLLDESAMVAMRRWRFTPALANGHPVRVWIAVPVRFSLR